MKLTSSTLVTVVNLALASKIAVAERARGLRANDFTKVISEGARKLNADTCGSCTPVAGDNSNLGTVTGVSGNAIDIDLEDGSYADWNLDKDFIGYMWNQGSSGKDLVGAAYARYDPQDGDKDSRLCILALSNETVYFEPNALSNQWIKLYGAALPGNPSNSKPNGGIIQDVGALDPNLKNGWEGCFPNIAPNCYNNVEIHSNWGYTLSYGNTASTGKNINNKEVTFALCLQGKTCTDPAECETACETYDCTESECVNPMTKGDSCCATSADCEQPDEPCKEAVCEPDDVLNYNICKTTTKEDGECLPAGTVEIDECTTSADCFGVNIEESADCATAKCEEPSTGGGKKCTYTPRPENAEMPCGDSKSGTYSAYDVCDLGFRCSSTNCVVQYASVETDCTDSTDSFWRTMVADAGLSEVCHTAKCQLNSTDVSTSSASADERTTCQPVEKPDDTKCGYGDGNVARGDCDDENRCVEGLCQITDNTYKPGFVCRGLQGCCDEEDKCEVGNFNCPEDLKKQTDFTCREVCEDCAGDVKEVCPGDSNDCPQNVIFYDELCIMAGQHMHAGTVYVDAKAMDGGMVQFSARMHLAPDWSLKSGDESIKSHWGMETPFSNSGRYGNKADGNALDEMRMYTFESIPNIAMGSTFYFAIHLDVVGPGGEETAWAMPCDSTKHLEGIAFTNKKGAQTGWGKFSSYTPCNPEACALTCAEASGGIDETEATASPGAASYQCSCSCNADGGVETAAVCSAGDSTRRRAREFFTF